MSGARLAVSAELAGQLIADQFPHWAALPVVPVAQPGWDNHTFRLGPHLLARFPSAGRYGAQVERDQAWLPRLAAALPVAIPRPVAQGQPGRGYPFAWSVFAWIEGHTLLEATGVDPAQLARDLAGFLRALQAIDPHGAPPPGPQNFWRGASPRTYQAEALAALDALPVEVAPPQLRARLCTLWHTCTASDWTGPPVWLHGDLAPGNLLVRGGRLCAVIDFGQMAVGDPACDFAIAWQHLPAPARALFRQEGGVDSATWHRAAAWALWKAAIRLAGHVTSTPRDLALARTTLAALREDFAGSW
jgi:aminoglycoside phosphotransferase (APT) family kinase protein